MPAASRCRWPAHRPDAVGRTAGRRRRPNRAGAGFSAAPPLPRWPRSSAVSARRDSTLARLQRAGARPRIASASSTPDGRLRHEIPGRAGPGRPGLRRGRSVGQQRQRRHRVSHRPAHACRRADHQRRQLTDARSPSPATTCGSSTAVMSTVSEIDASVEHRGRATHTSGQPPDRNRKRAQWRVGRQHRRRHRLTHRSGNRCGIEPDCGRRTARRHRGRTADRVGRQRPGRHRLTNRSADRKCGEPNRGWRRSEGHRRHR